MSRRFPLLLLLSWFLAGALRGQGLAVTAVSPASQSLSAARDTPIDVTFDHPLAPLPDDAFLAFGRWSGVHTGSLTLEAGNTRLHFTPARPFSAGERVTVFLTRTIQAADGSRLDRGYSWQFWIRPDPASLDLSLDGLVDIRDRSTETWIQSYGAYAGDLDGDGFSDLVIPNERTNDVRVFLNDGTGHYGGYRTYALPDGNRPSPNEGMDFDRDGTVDVAVGNSQNDRLSLLMGRGDGTFEPVDTYTAEDAVRGVAVLDLDGDGYADVVTTNREGSTGFGTLSVFLNSGDGTLSAPSHLDTPGNQETAIEAADMNGDGLLDLVVGALLSEEILVYLADADGGLRFQSRTPSGGQTWMLATGDLDGDGFTDVVSANSLEASAGVLLGDGQGGLSPAVTYPTGTFPLAIDLGDLDGDGDLDLVTSDFGGPTWTLYENDGTGVFVNRRTFFAQGAGSCAVLHDRDNDGTLDMTGIDELEDRLFLFRNTPRATAVEPLPHSADTHLAPGFPNPFHTVTEFAYELRRASTVSARVYSVSGRLVRRLMDEQQPPGRHRIRWDGTDDLGLRLPSGLYFLRLETDGVTMTTASHFLR